LGVHKTVPDESDRFDSLSVYRTSYTVRSAIIATAELLVFRFVSL